jgi:NTP pyrophosphatase (non-canonical NTP hydrolase)
MIEETKMTESLADLEVAIQGFVAERDWAQFHTPKNLAMGVAIEAAELMEHFLWATGEESSALDAGKRKQVANEIGDVLIYLLGLGRMLDIDIVAAARDKLAINREKYPVEKAKGRAVKYVDLD